MMCSDQGFKKVLVPCTFVPFSIPWLGAENAEVYGLKNHRMEGA